MTVLQHFSFAMRHPVGRLRSWRPVAEPVQSFIASRLYDAPGNRLATVVIWRAWQRHCQAHGINYGTSADLIAAVRAKFPEARMVKGVSGRDTRPGKRHLTAIGLR